MIRINLMFVCALTLAILSSVGVNAQTKVWGVGASVGVADGAFQNPFISTGTAGSYSPTSWTALSVNDNNGTVTPGAAYWTRSLLGYSQGFYAAPPGQTPPPMPSPSQANGIAIFDSGFLDNNGTSTLGSGTSPTTHRGELISPRIDLTGYTDSSLVIQFYSEYRDFQINELSVSLSTDDGVTWGTPYDYRILQATSSPGWVRVLMPTATQGVPNLSQSRLRFVFDNDYYYAAIDDITIETAPAYDIAMGNPDPASNFLVGNGDFVKIGGNRYQAESNLDPTNLKEWFWGGKVVNYGAQTLLPQDSASIHVRIDYSDDINPPVLGVYRDTMYIDTLAAGDPTGVTMIDYLRDINFLMTNGQGRYQVSYWVTHKFDDGNATNDTVTHLLNITGTPTSYVSKARRAASDGRVFAGTAMFPSGSEFSAFEYGSVYYFPQGSSNNLSIDSVEFRYQVPNGYTGAASQTLFVNIYRVTDGSGAGASDGTIDGDELLHVGVAPVILTGLGTTVTAGSYALATATAFVNPGSGNPIAGLDNHGIYYISVLQNPSLLGGPATFNAASGLWHGADNYNYYMNAAMTLPDTLINPSPLMVTDAAGTSTWYWTGFGADVVPSIGVHLKPYPLGSSIIPVIDDASEMSIFPNPAGNYLNVNVKYEEATDVQYIMTDISGRVLKMFSSTQVTEETQTINLDQLTSGVYLITAKSDKGVKTERFVKK